MCDGILDLVELNVPNPRIGTADLRRVKGMMIDREQREYFYENDFDDFLNYTITIYDTNKTNSLESKVRSDFTYLSSYLT